MSLKVGPTYPTLFSGVSGVSGGSSVSGVSGVVDVSTSEYNLQLGHVGFLFCSSPTVWRACRPLSRAVAQPQHDLNHSPTFHCHTTSQHHIFSISAHRNF